MTKNCAKCISMGNQLRRSSLKCKKTGEKITPQGYCSAFKSRILNFGLKKLDSYDQIRGF